MAKIRVYLKNGVVLDDVPFRDHGSDDFLEATHEVRCWFFPGGTVTVIHSLSGKYPPDTPRDLPRTYYPHESVHHIDVTP